jgi:aminoglycoside 3-N-acetyltransferase
MAKEMSVRNLIRFLVPAGMLKWYRAKKKNRINRQLQQQAAKGGITRAQLLNDLWLMGIKPGETILVHSSLSSIGYVEGGAETVIGALMDAVGISGNILMPTSPNSALQLEYIQKLDVFDVHNTPSALGRITEVFRKMDGVWRGAHPTEPVAAMGPDAEWLIAGHLGEPTPYTANSPFRRIIERNGKILYVGVTLDNAGTSLHTLEDAVDFPYPVYHHQTFTVRVIDMMLDEHFVPVKVHNPEMSRRRKCDQLLPMFEREGVMQRHRLGQAQVLLFDAKRMFDVMVQQFEQNGVTMYTPNGGKL